MAKVEQPLSERIAALGLVCAFGVVVDHAVGGGTAGRWDWWIMQVVSKGVCQIPVPFFFVVSGFFLAGHMEEPNWWRRECVKRVRSLLVPFFIWAAVGTAWFLLTHPRGAWETGARILNYVGLCPFSLPTLTPLWYLRALLCLVFASPLLYFLVKRFRVVALVFWFGLSLVLSFALKRWPEWNNFCGNFFPLKWGCFWFSLGIALRLRPVRYSRARGCATGAVGLGLVIGSKFLLIAGSPCAALLQKVSVPFLLWGFWTVMPVLRVPRWLTASAFPVYLVHMMILDACRMWLPGEGIGGYVIRIVVGIGGSLALVALLRQLPGRVGDVIFGGR